MAAPEADLVNVFETSSPATIALVRLILESANIEFYVRGEDLQNLWPPISFHPMLGPFIVQVGRRDERQAKQVLKSVK